MRRSHTVRPRSGLGALVIAGGAFMGSLLSATPAQASCSPGPSLQAMAEDPSTLPEDDTFFIGRATRILPAVESDLDEFNDTSVFTPVVMRVEAAIRGQVLERVVVMDAGGTLPGGVGVGGEGTIGFRAERRYVVVGSLDADGTYRVDACTDTGPISEGDARTLIRLAGGREATRPLPISDSANSGGSNTLVILLAFLAGAGVSTVVVLARRHRLAADRHESGAG